MASQNTNRTTLDYISEFRAAIEAAGISFKGELAADDKLHRVHVEGDRPGSRNGWYVLHIEGARPAGAFGCNKRFGKEAIKWSAKGTIRLSAEERAALKAKIKADRERREADEARRQEAAAEAANRIWNAAKPSGYCHPYLLRKAVMGDGLRVAAWLKEFTNPETGEVRTVRVPNALLVPILDGKNHIVSIQAIFPNARNALGRDKDFLRDGKKSGCYFLIGAPTEVAGKLTLVVCEGYATGASINLATDLCTVIAFDAGNLRAVAARMRDALPDARIIIAADNDRWTEEPINNPGVHYATLAAHDVDGVLVVPEFPYLDTKPTDFNDLQALASADEVHRQIMAVIRTAPEEHADA